MELLENYRKYRWFYTSSGKLVVGGKSAEQNDELLKQIKSSGKEYLVMHTSTPGSPFSVILEEISDVYKEDLEETAIFTGCFSKAWKLGKKKETIDIFSSSSLSKSRIMKPGTWAVKDILDRKEVNLILVLTKQQGVLRAVPERTAKPKEVLLKVSPGKIDKLEMLSKIQMNIEEDLNQEELLSSLPSGGVQIIK